MRNRITYTEQSKKLLKVLEHWWSEKAIRDCTITGNSDGVINVDVLTGRSTTTLKNMKHAIPSAWTNKDLGAYILAVGDLPTPAKARKLQKLQKLKEQEEGSQGGT